MSGQEAAAGSVRNLSTYREKKENEGAGWGTSETLGAHSTAAVRSAPNLAQLSAAAVPLGSPGGDGTEGSEPAAFVRGGAAPGTKRAAELAEETSALPGGRGGALPSRPVSAAGGSGAWTAGQQTVRGRQREPHGKRRPSAPRPPPRPPARSVGSPGAPSPFPRRLLPLALTFRDGLRWALPPLAARAPSRRRGDAGGEAEPLSPGGRGSAAPPAPGLPPGAG